MQLIAVAEFLILFSRCSLIVQDVFYCFNLLHFTPTLEGDVFYIYDLCEISPEDQQ